MSILALDIGGANLKASDGADMALSRPFPLWKDPGGLTAALGEIVAANELCDAVVATMTGELADCYASKPAGVTAIVEAVVAAAGGRPVSIYLTDGRFVAPDVAIANPRLAAASNWHALARFACRYLRGASGLLIDIGSTTSDLIPLAASGVAAIGMTDPQRLATGELVYTGVKRSPVCALVQQFVRNGEEIPVAQELFATTWDAYLLLEQMSEEPAATHTADGRPATRLHARQRLARMICADRDEFTLADARLAAEQIVQAQRELLQAALAQILTRQERLPETVVTSGCGEFLARELVVDVGIDRHVVSLREELGASKSDAAPAYALAVLARESIPS